MSDSYRGADAVVDTAFEEKIRKDAETVIEELLATTSLKKGDILVVG